MTDEEIKAAVAKYIIDGYESDNADCLHEMDEWQTGEESEQDDLNKGYDFYRTARVTVTWDDPEGGVSVPAGDSPDSPAPGEARLPGGSDDYLPGENHPDDSAGIEGLTLLEKISGIPSNGILLYDTVLPERPTGTEYWTPFRNRLSRSKANEGSTN